MLQKKEKKTITDHLFENEEQDTNPDANRLSYEQIVACLKNVLNPESWPQAISILNQYLLTKKLNYDLFDPVVDLLINVQILILNNNLQNPNHLISIIDLFYNIIFDDAKIAHLLIEHNIHQIFFPFIQQRATLKLFNELLKLNQAPDDLNSKAITCIDHDQRQIKYETICIRERYNLVAHFCIENNIANKLLQILNSESKDDVLDIIRILGEHYFSFESFIPVFGSIFQIIYQDPAIKTRCYAIDSISTFAGSSKIALQHFINMQEFKNLFINYPIESPEIINSLLYCAGNVMSISEYLDDQNTLIFLSFASKILQTGDSDLLNLSIKVISKGTRKGEIYTLFCMKQGIIKLFFQMLESGSVSFKIQSQLFIAICNFFESSNIECAKEMVDLGFFYIISEYLEPMSSDRYIMEDALDALSHALNLAEKYPAFADWIPQIFENEKIIEPIEAYDLGPDSTSCGEESVEVMANSFLMRNRY